MYVFLSVLGVIPPSELGVTMSHEHLSADFSTLYHRPPRRMTFVSLLPLSMNNMNWIRQYP